MTKISSTQTTIQLLQHYRYIDKMQTRVKYPKTAKGDKFITIDLGFVTYHGTERYVIERWRKNDVTFRRLSLTNYPKLAALFATYNICYRYSSGDVVLRNGCGSSIRAGKHASPILGIAEEYDRINNGRVINAIAFFDTIEVIDYSQDVKGVERCGEEDGNFGGIKIVKDRLPEQADLSFSSLFASLELDMTTGHPGFRVFNQKLWDQNFSVGVPDLTSFGTFPSMIELSRIVF